MAPLVSERHKSLCDGHDEFIANQLKDFDSDLVRGEQNNEVQYRRHEDVRDILTHGARSFLLFAV
jgi:hypothetical protein